VSNDAFGYGQQGPGDAADDFNITTFLVRQMMLRMRTMVPVVVKAVTGGGAAAAPPTVDVQPLVNQVDGNGNPQPHGTVHGIPVLRIQGGDSAIVIDPKVDDVGYVAVSDRDMSTIKKTKKPSNPGSWRSYDLADGVYVGGLFGAAPTQYALFDDSGMKFLDRNGNTILGSSSGLDVTPKTGQPVTIHGDEVVTGNLTVDGTGHIVGNVTLDGALGVTGKATVGSFEIGTGATITRILTGTKTTNFGGAITTGTITTTTLTVTGARAGDYVAVGLNGGPGNGLMTLYAWVSSNDTVTLGLGNPYFGASSLPVSTSTYNVIVIGTT
jgi:hypothetical protein